MNRKRLYSDKKPVRYAKMEERCQGIRGSN